MSAVLKCDVPCVWALICERLRPRDELDRLTRITPPKDWRPGGHMGPRQMVRPDWSPKSPSSPFQGPVATPAPVIWGAAEFSFAPGPKFLD